MKTKLKLGISLLLSAAMLTTACFAAIEPQISIDKENDKIITVFGNVEGVKKGDKIRIQILKAGKTGADIRDDYTGETLLEDFLLVTQLPADENGGYSVTVNMDGNESDFYTVRINGEEGEIFYATTEYKENIIKDIITICARPESELSTAVSELKELFEITDPKSVTVKALNITDKAVFAVGENRLFESLYNVVNDMEEELSVNNVVSAINLAAYIVAIDEGKGDIKDYEEAFNLDEKYTAVYEEKLTDDVKKAFNKDFFEGKGYESVKEINEAYNEAVLISWINNASWGDVEDVIEDFGEEVGVDIDAYEELSTVDKNELIDELLDIEKFKDTDEFAKKANDIMKNLGDDDGGSRPGGSGGRPSGGNGGGGTGGGTIGGNSGNTSVTPIEPDGNTQQPSTVFGDLAGFEWAVESIEALAEKGIVNGTGANTFEPAAQVTREEILAMLLRAYEIEEVETSETFTDVADDGWYKGVVTTAKELGFVNGRPDGTFGIGDSVTREDVAVMAYNIAVSKGVSFDTSAGDSFADDTEIASYAKDAVYALKNAEVLSGKGEGKFDPKASCTRAEAAKIIYTLITK